MKKLFIILCVVLLTSVAYGQATLKVGYVNMNKAINLSNEGKRSKKFLEAQAQQTQTALKAKENEVRQKEAELRNNIMLNKEAKEQKQKEIGRMKQSLRRDISKAQKSIRQDEMRHTAKIFKDLVLVIKKIAEEEKFDLVLEFNVKQTILYSRYDMIDLTDKVTKRYDQMQSIK